MTSAADEIIAARRARVVEVIDARGRTIGVRRICKSEQLRIVEAAESSGDQVALLCAAAVTSIDDNGALRACRPNAPAPVLWSIASALGDDGRAAVAFAMWQHEARPAGGTPDHDPFRPFASVGAIGAAMPTPLDLAVPLSAAAFTADRILPLFHKT